MRKDQEFFERRILTGLIVSKDYLDRIHKFWNPELLESPELRTISEWCIEYYKKYNQAPDRNIEAIYMEKLKAERIPKSEAEYIEEILSNLSDEYGRDRQFNSPYLYDKTIEYLKAKELEKLNDEIKSLIEMGQIDEAEKMAQSYRPSVVEEIAMGLDLSTKDVLDKIDRAFNETSQQVITYPGALGEIWNEHLVRGGFVSFLGPEKRGKTFWLLELSLRAVRQKANVAFFAAGDMTESQMLARICIYIAKKSNKEKYCRERFCPVGDCILNQIDSCTRKDRNCDHGIFEGTGIDSSKRNRAQFVNIETLKKKWEEFPDYSPCDSYSCKNRQGSVWLKKIPESRPLNAKEAKKKIRLFFKKYKRRFKLIAHPAGTLTVNEIKNCLDTWEKHDGFVPDVVVIDYADLLSAEDSSIKEFRHKQDHVWKSLRALSQARHALVVTATQADADSYKRGRLSLSNFSEDKRKLAHVTAQYGLNQDPQGREKALGIMRINEIIVREGEFSADNEVCVLQDLPAGRAYLESYKEARSSPTA